MKTRQPRVQNFFWYGSIVAMVISVLAGLAGQIRITSHLAQFDISRSSGSEVLWLISGIMALGTAWFWKHQYRMTAVALIPYVLISFFAIISASMSYFMTFIEFDGLASTLLNIALLTSLVPFVFYVIDAIVRWVARRRLRQALALS